MTIGLERLWAGWRSDYVATPAADRDGDEACAMCRVLRADSYVVWRGPSCSAVLNAYPYASGHLLVVPNRHVAELEETDEGESSQLWVAVQYAVRALKVAYGPDGINVGANLGESAGAGVPGHLHLHVLPRWTGDTNFMTTVAEVRVLPESLPSTFEKLRAAWPT
ncbi:MAG TPA: HIT domain-containing protein [Acidimicrobiales bacterium]|nr:HIT domain-containing protein [Acidimicrobiales bacterium]